MRKSTHDQDVERFWSKVQKVDGGCWLWTGGRFVGGYAQFSVHRLAIKAHRFSYFLEHGDLPAGKCICHTCDVKHCVHPAHLFAGTAADNVADRNNKGRTSKGDAHYSRTRKHVMARGEAQGHSKLKIAEVIEIRSESTNGVSYKSLAKRFGVDPVTIGAVVRRQTWRHIP